MIFIYILFLLIFIYIILALIGRNYKNPYKLIMIFGKKGSGKTTFFTKLAIQYQNKGISVYSNVPIYGCKLFDIRDLGLYIFPPESVVLIDEVKMIWDSRNFKSFPEHVRNYFILQRHYRNTVYLASQQFNIDKTLRDLCDELYLLTCINNVFSVAKRINKKITIHNGDDDNESFLTEDFRFDLPFFWHFTFIPRWSDFFDSFDHKNISYIDYKEIKNNSYFLEYLTKTKNYLKYKFAAFTYFIARNINLNNWILKIKFLPRAFYISRSYYIWILLWRNKKVIS